MLNNFSFILHKRSIVIADFLLLLALLSFLPFDPQVNKGLSILVFVAILWLTEAVHISITALLVPLLAVSLNIFNTPTALSNFADPRSEEHTSELQSRPHLVCRLLLEKKKKNKTNKQGVRKRIARTKRNCVNDGCTQPCSRRLSVDDCLACHLVRWTRIHSCTVTRADC